MASIQEARVGLYYGWAESDGFAAQMDVNILVMAFLLNPAVINRTQISPPASPNDGNAYIVASSGATGIFAGQENNFVMYVEPTGTWYFIEPKDGQEAVVISEGTWGTKIVHKGGVWSPGVALG
jgi:hypothetical protein